MIPPMPLWNTVIPAKQYVILSGSGNVIGETMADTARQALSDARKEHGAHAKTALIKSEWTRTENLSKKWMQRCVKAER